MVKVCEAASWDTARAAASTDDNVDFLWDSHSEEMLASSF